MLTLRPPATPVTILSLAFLIVQWAPGQVLTITPAAPKVGTHIAVSYDESAGAAAIKGRTSLGLEALIMRPDDYPLLKEVPLVKKGNVWSGGFLLDDERSLFVILRLVSGDLKDDNGGRPWSVLVYGKDGKAVRDARVNKATFVAGVGFMDFKHEKDFPAAYALLREERNEHPGNYRATTTEWMLMSREKPGEETRKVIASSLPAYEKKFGGDEPAMAAALTWFEQTGQKTRADSLKAAAIRSNPKGKIAESVRQAEIYQERNPAGRAALLEKFIADFPPKGPQAASLNSMLADSYFQAGKVESAISLLNSMPQQDPGLYNQIAWGMIEKGENLEQAVALAKRGVDLARKPDAAAKPPYLRATQWKDQSEFALAAVLDTYAFGLYKLGKYADAAPPFAEAYALSKGGAGDITERYLDCLLKAGRDAEAMKVSGDIIAKGKESPAVVKTYKASYTKINGSESGLEAALAGARAAGEKSAREALLKSRLDTPAIDFTLNDLGGKPVKLSGQRGKVVVIDFWATWCGPCKSSFPTLQKVYDRYRANANVAIYAVNTWERVAGAERKNAVEKFMADNRYTFPVLYDDSFVEKYGVEGIPTKFVIDKKGKIAFKSVGFNGPDEMEKELTGQLELLLAE